MILAKALAASIPARMTDVQVRLGQSCGFSWIDRAQGADHD
jgi:hypothetical protein